MCRGELHGCLFFEDKVIFTTRWMTIDTYIHWQYTCESRNGLHITRMGALFYWQYTCESRNGAAHYTCGGRCTNRCFFFAYKVIFRTRWMTHIFICTRVREELVLHITRAGQRCMGASYLQIRWYLLLAWICHTTSKCIKRQFAIPRKLVFPRQAWLCTTHIKHLCQMYSK